MGILGVGHTSCRHAYLSQWACHYIPPPEIWTSPYQLHRAEMRTSLYGSTSRNRPLHKDTPEIWAALD